MLPIFVLVSASYSSGRIASTSSAPPYPLVGGIRIAVSLTPSPTPIDASPDRIGGPYLVPSRTQLGICISDTTGSLSNDQKQDYLLAALAEIQTAYPQWAAARLTPAPLLLGLDCPIASPILSPSVNASNIGGAEGSVAPSDRVSPFRAFIFVVSPDTIQRLFSDSLITSHTHEQEAVCNPGSDVCAVVSKGLYVTADEFADKSKLSSGLARVLSIAGGGTPSGGPVPVTAIPSPSPEPPSMP